MKKLYVLALFLFLAFSGMSQNVTLTNQAQVNAFNQTTVGGLLVIEGEDIVDLSPLNTLEIIGDGLIIQNCPFLLEIDGFENLDSVGVNELNSNLLQYPQSEGVQIQFNQNLTSISGFDNLDLLWKLEINNNENLKTIEFKTDEAFFYGYIIGGTSHSGSFGDVYVQNNPNLELIQANFSCWNFKCESNGKLQDLDGVKLSERLKRLILVDNPSLLNTPTTSTTSLQDFQIVNTAIDTINQFENLRSISVDNIGRRFIRNNKFLRSVSFQNLSVVGLTIDSNAILSKISIPNYKCVDHGIGGGSPWPLIIKENPQVDTILVGTECSNNSNCYYYGGDISILSNESLRHVEALQHSDYGCANIANNPNLNSLILGVNVDKECVEVENSPDVDIIYSTQNDYNILWSDSPDTLVLSCTADSLGNMSSIVYAWIESHTVSLDCNNYEPNTYWSFFDSYQGPANYDIDLFVPFISGDTIYKVITLEVLDSPELQVIKDPEPFLYLCDDLNYEADLNVWLDNQGYASISQICDEVTWVNDFTELESGDTTPVSFTSTNSQGELLLSFTGTILNPSEETGPEIISSPTDLEVVCDNALDYQDVVNTWLDNNADGLVVDPCALVTWSHNYNFQYSVGSYQVNFEAFSQSGVLLDESVTLTILPGIDPPNITSDGETLTLFESDPILEIKIQAWLNNQAGAEAIQNCGTFTWSHNYTFDSSPGEYLVTFSATSDNGAVSKTSATLIIEMVSSLEDESEINVVIIAPNPVSDVLSLSGVDAGQQWQIYSLNGECVMKGQTTSSSQQIEVGVLIEGIYFFEIPDLNGKVEIQRFLKM